MENLDLNIDNYSLDDILNLFHLSSDFTEDDLKEAKKMVLMTHPDKSHMDAEVFLFFTKVYKYLYFIFQFRHRSDMTVREELDHDEQSHSDIITKIKEKKDFHKVFNQLFEEHKISDEFKDSGYKNWLSSEEGLSIPDQSVHNMTDMRDAFYEEKKKRMDLIQYRGVQDTEDMTHSDLSGKAPQNYSSSLFSKLAYEDVKVAHTENIIPVSEQDYDPSKHFQSLTQLQSFREKQTMTPFSESQSRLYREDKQKIEARENTRRAYLLAKQMEDAQQKNAQFLSKFKYLQ